VTTPPRRGSVATRSSSIVEAVCTLWWSSVKLNTITNLLQRFGYGRYRIQS
jgi:hypothetical protein